MNKVIETIKENNFDNKDVSWVKKLGIKLLFEIIPAILIINIVLEISTVHYPTSSDGVIEADISLFSVRLYFPHNTIVRVEGNKNNYEILSYAKLANHGSIIRLFHNPQQGQNLEISFIDDNNEVIKFNFTSSFFGANSITIRKNKKNNILYEV